jgi:hypothetical protein
MKKLATIPLNLDDHLQPRKENQARLERATPHHTIGR